MKMNNGDLAMHIHKQITVGVDLHMCAEIVIQRSSMQKEVIRQFTTLFTVF